MLRLLVAFLSAFPLICGAMSVDEKAVDALFGEFANPGAPGAAVMVVRDSKPLLVKAYGLADLQNQIPCRTNTNFRLASVTKQFTAMAVLILSERGKLSLDDKITRFFPEFPEYGKDVTVRHLLTHTSGVPDYEDFTPTGTTMPLSDLDVLYILRQQKALYFEPGKEFRYSNSGYALLALIVEVASGKTFPAFLAENIFKPLGMTNSIAYVAGVSVVPNRSFGYVNETNSWKFSDQSLTSAVLGDGGVYSSVVDLFKWDQALYGEHLVSRKTLDDAFTIHSQKSDFEGSGYGYGWYSGEFRGTKHVWHYGSTCGFSTKIERFPDRRLTVVILSNRREANLTPIMEKLIEWYW